MRSQLDRKSTDRKLRHTLLIAFILSALAASTACNASQTEEIQNEPETQTQIEVSEVGESNHIDQPKDTQPGGVFVYPVPSCGVPDPAIDPTLLDGPMAGEIHAGLTRIGDNLDSPVEMELAKKYDISDNGTTYLFTLRDDLKFSDGSPITTGDIKWSWERAASLATKGSNAQHVFEAVIGFEDVVNGDRQEMSGIRVVDNQKLRVALRNPVAHFPMLIADQVAYVLKRDNVENWDVVWTNRGTITLGEHPFLESGLPVGAGPFKLSKLNLKTDQCELERNEHYWARQPYINRVIFKTNVYGQEVDTPIDLRNRLFENEQIDYTDSEFSEADGNKPKGQEVMIQKAENTEYLLFNPTLPPLDNVHFRRALSAASIDFISQGSYVARLLPPSLVNDNSIVSRISFDPDTALAELAMCQCADRLDQEPIEYHSPYLVSAGHPIDLVFDGWKQHLDVTAERIMASFPDVSHATSAGATQIISVSLQPRYPDPSAIIQPLLNAIPGGETDPEVAQFQEMATRAASEADTALRMNMYQEIEQQILNSSLIIPVVMLETASARVQSWVHGFDPPKFGGGSIFYNIWLENPPERNLE